MTPFGEKLRMLRAEREIQLKDMAASLGVSAAYLSALEHGHRGKPNRRFVHQVCQYFGIIWDEAEALQALADRSHPRVVVDTAGLPARATELANLLAEKIRNIPIDDVDRLLTDLKRFPSGDPRRRGRAR